MLITSAHALTAAQWRAQSIYQVLTDRFARSDNSTTHPCSPAQQAYCGGTYQGLLARLDYIQNLGFTAIWISPFTSQITTSASNADGASYHGYWADDIWRLNEAFGTEADLLALGRELKRRGMYLMADVVPNHMAWEGCRGCVDYGRLKPWDRGEFYHSPCGIDYANQTQVEVCWAGSERVSLPDLRTEREDVRKVWNDWVRQMVAKYGIDGIRIDSAKHIEPSFYPGFAAAASVYLLGEVYSGDPPYVVPYQKYMDGVLDYPSYYWILRAFRSASGSIPELASGLTTLKNSALDTSLYGSFLENHDVGRFGYFTSDLSRAKNAIAFTFLKDGIPIVYQGQEQGFRGAGVPLNREALWLSGYDTSTELYAWIARLNRVRSWVIAQDERYLTYRAHVVFSDANRIVLRKGYDGNQVVSVYTNLGETGSAGAVTLAREASGFGAGQGVVDVMSCEEFTVGADGSLGVAIVRGLPRVLYPAARLAGSGICPGVGGDPVTSTLTSTSSTSSTPTPTPTPSCSNPVQVEFQVLASTVWGETIKLLGNTTTLGSWTPTLALPLSPSRYTTASPVWWVSVALTPGTTIAYKFIKVSSSGAVTWQAGSDRVYSVGCEASGSVVVSGTW
ncbi:glycoside hydrolase superfamily [Cercophora newfieldiana]|uniref:alpha-amylase n=1 Tax=Cercophora newfieldiana TaxID=92897 RepID=A0AA40CZN5_9PEZI|nr:glycoside hydrolase superfamily [Cercophora newfieldiana]